MRSGNECLHCGGDYDWPAQTSEPFPGAVFVRGLAFRIGACTCRVCLVCEALLPNGHRRVLEFGMNPEFCEECDPPVDFTEREAAGWPRPHQPAVPDRLKPWSGEPIYPTWVRPLVRQAADKFKACFAAGHDPLDCTCVASP